MLDSWQKDGWQKDLTGGNRTAGDSGVRVFGGMFQSIETFCSAGFAGIVRNARINSDFEDAFF
jgi:hypothetical protein